MDVVSVSALGAIVALIISITLIIKKIHPAYALILGALIGGLSIGLLETLSKAYISTTFSDAIVFGILIIILIIKPAGLLGKKTNEKV